jgi:hypothetical protein
MGVPEEGELHHYVLVPGSGIYAATTSWQELNSYLADFLMALTYSGAFDVQRQGKRWRDAQAALSLAWHTAAIQCGRCPMAGKGG